ncbi:MAG TPA: Type 1 glutamine amidotransferase-like domain-containing protein [Patescibacteria group bacterium]|nr:Type 1 glutamine amidotransferase-like domain-containing protein [Patescibacteria group bacterium]
MNLTQPIERLIKKYALDKMKQARPKWNVPHLRAAVFYLKKIMRTTGGNPRILIPAIYLHDIGYAGKLPTRYTFADNQKIKNNHMIIGAIMAKQFLNTLSVFTAKEIQEICHLIRIHDNLKKINTRAEQIIFESDSLAQIDVKKVKPNFNKINYQLWLTDFQTRRVPIFKTQTGKKYLNALLPSALNYYPRTTKYILHGGRVGRATEANQSFFKEIIRGVPSSSNILCIYLARDKKTWSDDFRQDQIHFLSVATPKTFRFTLASDKVTILKNQIKEADVIYIRGGNSHILQKHLKKITGLQKLWQGKVVAGSSAGALVLSRHYYENDDNTYNRGLGILPIQTICHYKKKNIKKFEMLQIWMKKGEKKKNIYAIPEEKFIIIRR